MPHCVACRSGTATGSSRSGGAGGTGDDISAREAPEVCGGGWCWSQHRGVPLPSEQRTTVPVSAYQHSGQGGETCIIRS